MISLRYALMATARLVRIFALVYTIQRFVSMPSLKGVKAMAKTYRVSGYVVEPSADDWNGTDIVAILDRYTDTFNNLKVKESPTWEWDDDCPENHFDLTDEMCERRFGKENA